MIGGMSAAKPDAGWATAAGGFKRGFYWWG